MLLYLYFRELTSKKIKKEELLLRETERSRILGQENYLLKKTIIGSSEIELTGIIDDFDEDDDGDADDDLKEVKWDVTLNFISNHRCLKNKKKLMVVTL